MSLNRRQFVRVISQGAAAIAIAQQLRPAAAAQRAASDPLVSLDGLAQAKMISAGEISPLEAVELAIARIERLNPKINAVVTADFDAARARASENKFKGPFAGVTFLVKDLDDFKGTRMTGGSRAGLTNISETTQPYVQACIDAGVNVVGKSNTPELGLTPTTESLALGPCYNPWDLTRSAGGSSGGAGAAVAAGLVAIAQGSDGGGSIRIPASCCGVFGLKPSRSRLMGSKDEFEFGVDGVLSRSVRDTAHALVATERKTPGRGLKPVGLVTGPSKRRLKIGMYLKGSGGVVPSPEVSDAIMATAKLCEELGHDVQISKLDLHEDSYAADFLTLWASYAGEAVAALEKERGRKATLQDFEPLTLAFAEQYHGGGKEKVPAASERLQQLSKDVNQRVLEYDVLLSPVLSTPPPLVGQYSPTLPFAELLARMTTYVAYTPLFNVTGMPAMSVPLHWTKEGLPVGSQFAARLGDERTLLELAYELEAARPWADKWAPWSAVKAPA
ncbi:MAG: amidase [Gemmataceae bacterium]